MARQGPLRGGETIGCQRCAPTHLGTHHPPACRAPRLTGQVPTHYGDGMHRSHATRRRAPPLAYRWCAAGAALLLGAAASGVAAAGSVSGTVLDTQGRPLEGARIEVKRDFTYGQARTTSGAGGRYRIDGLTAGTYRVFAYVERPYEGGTVCQRLAAAGGPADYNALAVPRGGERSFRWRLSGALENDAVRVGAQLRLANSHALYASTTALVFTFTPTTPLLDGSAGETLVRELALRPPSRDDAVDDLPLGVYRLRVEAIGKDGLRRPLAVADDPAAPLREAIELRWTSTGVCGFAKPSGVQPLRLWLQGPRGGALPGR